MDHSAGLVSRQVTSVPGAIRRMEEIAGALSPEAGILRFNQLYWQVTSTIEKKLKQEAYFKDKAFLRLLDVNFANRYFAALRSWTLEFDGQVSRAWEPMFESSYLRAVTGIQYAAAGVNTHINFDLALALVDTWQALGPPDVGGRQRADYDRVTDIFGELYEQFRADLLSQDLEKFDKGLVQVALNLASHFVVDKARDAAWVSATEIYRVRKWKFVAKWYKNHLEDATRRIGQVILIDLR